MIRMIRISSIPLAMLAGDQLYEQLSDEERPSPAFELDGELLHFTPLGRAWLRAQGARDPGPARR